MSASAWRKPQNNGVQRQQAWVSARALFRLPLDTRHTEFASGKQNEGRCQRTGPPCFSAKAGRSIFALLIGVFLACVVRLRRLRVAGAAWIGGGAIRLALWRSAIVLAWDWCTGASGRGHLRSGLGSKGGASKSKTNGRGKQFMFNHFLVPFPIRAADRRVMRKRWGSFGEWLITTSFMQDHQSLSAVQTFKVPYP